MDRRGFTLLEVMVGLAVLSLMVFMIWQISSSSLDAEDRVDRRDYVFQMARLVTGHIVDDINMAFLIGNPDLAGKTKDGANVETAFVGDDKGNFDSVDFDSFSHWRMFKNAKEGDQNEVGYFVERDPEAEGEVYRLMRRESSYLDNDVTKGGKIDILADDVLEFQLEYYDGKVLDWTNNWNSKEVDQKNRLPRAVKIKLSFPDPEDKEEKITFQTTAFVELWQTPVTF